MRSFLIILAITVFMFSCKKENMGDCFKSTGLVQREVRITEPFDSLVIHKRMNLILIEDSIDFVEIEAGNKLLENIISENKFGTLTIENTNTCNWVRSYKIPVNIYLHYTKLQKILVLGSSQISNTDSLQRDSMFIELRDAAGDVNLTVSNKYLFIAQHTGASDVTIKGRTIDLSVYSSDLGYGDYLKLAAENVFAESNSVADNYFNASETIRLITRNKGSIYYTGEAEVLLKDRKGEGTISRIY